MATTQSPAVTLQQLANGVQSVSSTSSQAGGFNQNTLNPQPPALVQVGSPANFQAVNLTDINNSGDDTYQSTFFNGTGALRNLVLGGVVSLAGQYQYYGGAFSPSAVDFATFQDTGATLYPANAGTWQSLAIKFTQSPAIIQEIALQSNLLSQSQKNIVAGFIQKSLQIKQNTLYTSLCDACSNNNTTVYTKIFDKMALPVGQNNFINIPIVAMTDIGSDSTLVRLKWLSESVVSAQSQSSFM